MRVPPPLTVPNSKPPLPLAELGETAPEEFLREVVDTLAGLLRDESGARELEPGQKPLER